MTLENGETTELSAHSAIISANKVLANADNNVFDNNTEIISIDGRTARTIQEINGKVVEKGTYAKMARGEMVRFLAEQKAETPEVMKQFDRLGYHYNDDASDEKTYVFIKN